MTRLVILRWMKVGVSALVVVPVLVWSTRLTSCAISSDTAWLELIRGRTCRMTPVSRYSMLLTMLRVAEMSLLLLGLDRDLLRPR